MTNFFLVTVLSELCYYNFRVLYEIILSHIFGNIRKMVILWIIYKINYGIIYSLKYDYLMIKVLSPDKPTKMVNVIWFGIFYYYFKPNCMCKKFNYTWLREKCDGLSHGTIICIFFF